MAVISNAVNILGECFQHTSHNCRILVKGDLPIGKPPHLKLMEIDEKTNEISSNESLVRLLIEENEKLKNSVLINPGFRWLVRAAVGLSLLAFIVMIVLSFQTGMSETQERLFDICDDTWKIGFAAIIGLIGGKIS